MNDAHEKLQAAAGAVASAVMILKMQQPMFEAFLKECRDMENFGHIVDPTLYRDPERRAVSLVVKPLFEAALSFIAAHDAQIARAGAALQKVSR